MNISIIEPVGGHGGMNYYNYGLGCGLAHNGCNVDLYTCPETNEHSVNNFRINKFFKGVYGKDAKIKRLARFFLALLKSLIQAKTNKSKICHIHLFQYGLLELLTCFLSKTAGLKIIATVHDVEAFAGSSSRRIQTAIFRMASELIVHNEFSKVELEKISKENSNKSKITTIPHGNYVEFSTRQEKAAARQRLGLPANSRIILFFGQIKKVKGLEILIRAMPYILEKEPDTRLLIAGKVWKDSFDSYRDLIDELGIDRAVIARIEYIPDSEVDDYYSAADVVALPYRKIYQSGVLLMAMSYGCVTVSTRLPPMEDIVTDAVNGYLFSPEDHVDLANKILAATNTEKNSDISKMALEKVTSDHNWSKIAKMHMQVYKRHV